MIVANERTVCGYTLLGFGHVTSDTDLDALGALAYLAGKKAEEAGRTPVFAEIGSWVGESAVTMYAHCPAHEVKIHCIDTWRGSDHDHTGNMARTMCNGKSIHDIFEHNVQQVNRAAFFDHSGRGHDIVAGFKDRSLDLVFIDAEHTYDAVAEDIRDWAPKLREDGILCGHDFNTNGFPGTTDAVMDYGLENDMVILCKRGTTVWVATKPGSEHYTQIMDVLKKHSVSFLDRRDHEATN